MTNEHKTLTVLIDMVEAERTLAIQVAQGMIKLQVASVRAIADDGSFLLDSEEVDTLCDALRAAKALLSGERNE